MAGPCRDALDRGPPLRQHELRSGAGVFQRRPDRRNHQRARARAGIEGHRPDVRVRVQGPARRHPRIAEALGVDRVLEGSVRKGRQPDPHHRTVDHRGRWLALWSERYDREWRMFSRCRTRSPPPSPANCGRLAQPRARRAHTPRVEAYETYLMARHHQWQLAPGLVRAGAHALSSRGGARSPVRAAAGRPRRVVPHRRHRSPELTLRRTHR